MRSLTSRLVIAAVLTLLTPGLMLALRDALVDVGRKHDVWLLVLGAAAGAWSGRLVAKRLPVLGVLEHELTHLLVALVFLCRPTQFVVTGRGGLLAHTRCPIHCLRPLADSCITLAPYTVPTITVILLLLSPLVPHSLEPTFHATVGASFGYHLLTNWDELRQNSRIRLVARADNGELIPSDIRRAGLCFSLLFVPVTSIMLWGILFSVLARGFPGAGIWGQRVLHHTQRLERQVVQPWLAYGSAQEGERGRVIGAPLHRP